MRLPLRRLAFYRNPTLCAPVDEDFQFWLGGIDTVSGSSCAPVDSQEDKAVLALLYSATDGENWKDNSNWLGSRPIREWHGVTNDAEGRVTGLYLSENRLSGSIPPGDGRPLPTPIAVPSTERVDRSGTSQLLQPGQLDQLLFR